MRNPNHSSTYSLHTTVLTQITTTNRGEVYHCYDGEWDVDIGNTGEINTYIDDLCNGLDERGSSTQKNYPLTTADGTPFSVDMISWNMPGAESCREKMLAMIWTCVVEQSGGDDTRFKGGALIIDHYASVSIDCENSSCPR